MTKPAVADIDKLIGQRLKILRQRHKVSAAALAEAMESSQQQVSRYELGLNKISAALLWKLAHYFGVPLSWFFMDAVTKDVASPFIQEPRNSYDISASKEQLTILSGYWPELAKIERDAVLGLADTFIKLK